jgi:hypothetical protein
MKKQILMKVHFLTFALVMVFSFGACSKKANTGGTRANASRGSKIGILCSPVSWGEENYRMVEQCRVEFGDDKFIVNTIPDDADVQTIVSLATDMASNPEVGAIIMNEAAIGAIATMKAVREINPNILTFVINASEEPIEVAAVSDFSCMTAFEELGTALADAAYKKGLKYIVFEVPADQLGLTRLQKRVEACKTRCNELGITFIQTTLPGETDPNTRPALLQGAKEDVYNKINEYGDKVGFFPHSSFVFVSMFTAILDIKAGYIIGVADMGPFVPGYCDTFGITADADHVLDLAWTNKAISEKAIEAGMAGHFGNWEFPWFSTWMKASIVYALDYMDGKVERDNVDVWVKDFADVWDLTIGEDFTYFPFASGGKEYKNFVMINGKLKYYGEDLGT